MFGSDHKVKQLRDIPLLAGCSLSDLRLVASRGDVVSVRAGEVVSGPADNGRQFLVLLSGEARTDGNRRLQAGDTHGAVELLGESSTPSEVKMVRDGAVLVFGRREFVSLIRRVPGFGTGVARQLARLVGAAGR